MGNQTLEKLADGVYVVKDGNLKQVQAPTTGYGKTIINWEASKPTRAVHEYSEKL